MPSKKKSSNRSLSKNIKTYIKEGKTHGQAVALALSSVGKSNKK